jgi:hypothetical protein
VPEPGDGMSSAHATPFTGRHTRDTNNSVCGCRLASSAHVHGTNETNDECGEDRT